MQLVSLGNIRVDWLAAFLGVVLIAAGTVARSPSVSVERPELIPPSQLKYFSLGYNETVADVLWIRVLQDFDFCEARKVYDPDKVDPSQGVCNEGWVFHMIDAITELAPRFRQPYSSGGLLLSVLVNDPKGATIILDKGVAQFPTDLNILWASAYHALFEVKDEKKASALLLRTADAGGPPWLRTLSAKISVKSGQLQFARQTLQDALDRATDLNTKKHIQERLREVEAKIEAQ